MEPSIINGRKHGVSGISTETRCIPAFTLPWVPFGYSFVGDIKHCAHLYLREEGLYVGIIGYFKKNVKYYGVGEYMQKKPPTDFLIRERYCERKYFWFGFLVKAVSLLKQKTTLRYWRNVRILNVILQWNIAPGHFSLNNQ